MFNLALLPDTGLPHNGSAHQLRKNASHKIIVSVIREPPQSIRVHQRHYFLLKTSAGNCMGLIGRLEVNQAPCNVLRYPLYCGK